MTERSVILNFAPTGMLPTKEDNPWVPLAPGEILAEVGEALKLGITIVHLHVREEDGSPSLRTDLYAEVISGIRELDRELVICVSCSGRRSPELENRIGPLQLANELKPDMASLTLGSLNFSQSASITAPDTLAGLAREMLKLGIVPEVEVFDTGMLNVLNYLRKKSLIADPCYVNLLVGNIATAQLEAGVLGCLLSLLPPRSLWALGGLGASQLPANLAALAFGGGIRCGLEDNLFFDELKKEPARNLQLIERIHRIAGLTGKSIMSPAEFRLRMEMQPGNGHYGRKPVAA